MNEPERNENAGLAEAVRQPEQAQAETAASEPKAYAFDGWGMVPLEFDPI